MSVTSKENSPREGGSENKVKIDNCVNFAIRNFGNAYREVTIETPFDFDLSADEAAEILRRYWAMVIEPIRDGLRSSQAPRCRRDFGQGYPSHSE